MWQILVAFFLDCYLNIAILILVSNPSVFKFSHLKFKGDFVQIFMTSPYSGVLGSIIICGDYPALTSKQAGTKES